MVLFLREAMRAIASLGCEGVMRASLKHVAIRHSQQGPTPIFSAATADGITTVQTVSAAAATLPTTPTRDAARVKGYCTDRAILLCSAAQLTSCSSPTSTASWLTSSMLPHDSLGASQLLKPASTTPRSYGRRHRPWHLDSTTAMYMQCTASGAAGSGLYTTIRYMRGASGIGMGTTIKHLRCTTSGAAGNRRPGRNHEVPATHNERRREQWHEHHHHPPL